MGPFDSDTFTLSSLTAAINEADYAPRRLGEMGIFDEEGIATTTALVEKQGMSLELVPSQERGGVGQVVNADKRKTITFTAIHLPTTAAIMADEVQNVRQFGQEDQAQAIEAIVNRRLAKMAARLEVTNEHHRIGAVKGQILDADGTTVLVDLATEFDITRPTQAFALGTATTDVRERALFTIEKIEEGLGAAAFSGVVALCGRDFWANLIKHPKVNEAYLYQQSERLRADGREAFTFGGIAFERYRGGVGTTPFVPANRAYAFPTGVEEMFISRYAPANYADTVNTLGLPMYSSSEMMKHGKGMELEAQSNPIHLCTRPQAVVELS
ncbi:MAG: major capsid protein [Pseudomonadota bacterium]